MKKILISLSDIHYSSCGRSENQDLVLTAFIDDVVKQLAKMEYDDVYVLMCGDLVQSGDTENYNAFYQDVIKKILSAIDIPKNNIIVVPGNHDLQRDSITKKHHDFVIRQCGETDFNDLIREEDTRNLLFTKFHPFYQFLAQHLDRSVTNMGAYVYDIDELWSVMCLNSAILSEGGLNNWDDERYLAVDTRYILEWVSVNRTRKKILLMHHPINFYTEEFEHEIQEIANKNFDIVISGHTHYSNLYVKSRGIWITNPKLFTDKTEALGYSLLCIDDLGLDKIIYRQWSKERQQFTLGTNYTDDDDNPGVQQIRKTINDNEDPIIRYYQNLLSQKMCLYKEQPRIWIDRYVTKERLDIGLKSLSDYPLVPETELIDMNKSFYIYSPSDGGLTCYGINFLILLRKIYNQIGVFVDASTRNFEKFQQLVNAAIIAINSPSDEDIRWIILDQWRDDEFSEQKYIFLSSKYPNANIIFLTNQRERVDVGDNRGGLPIEGIDIYYLSPLDRKQLRIIASAYSKRDNQSDYKLLRRLDDDLRDFNMHRSPMNCITLLESFYQCRFEEFPINRTAVMSKFLSRIFEMADVDYLSTYPSMRECEYATGYFCSELIRQLEDAKQRECNAFVFTRKQYESLAQDIFDKQGTEISAAELFDILLACKIIVHYDSDLFTFRFRTWAYYFAASWMNVDDTFEKFILSERRYLHYPDIIEFYTGITQRQSIALQVLTNDLNDVIERIKTKFNVKDEYNPFSYLRLDPSEATKKKVVAVINKQIQTSTLPQAIKDHMIDKNYNPSAPYNQVVYQSVMEYTVKHMFSSIEISSKALRNTTLVDIVLKEKLLNAILSAWSVFAKVVSYMSKDFAHEKRINIDGLQFALTDEYGQLNEEERRISIVAHIPYNIMLLFKGYIYSPKMGKLLNDFFSKETDKIKKHLLACLIIAQTPKDWDRHIGNYIVRQTHDSFYLSDTLRALYSKKALSEPHEKVEVIINRLLSNGISKIDTNHINGGSKVLLTRGNNMADVPNKIKRKFIRMKK